MHALAIRKDGNTVRFSLITSSKRKFKIEFIQSVDEGDVKEAILKYVNLSHGNKHVECVIGMPSDQIFIRQLSFPIKNRRALMKTLPFQLESVVPFYDSPDARVVTLVKKSDEGFQVTPFAFMRAHLLEQIETYKEIGFDAEWVSCIPQALLRFARYVCPHAESGLVIFVGRCETHILSYIDGKIDVALNLHKGAAELANERFQQELIRSVKYCLSRDTRGKVEGLLQLGAAKFQSIDLGVEQMAISNGTIFSNEELKEFAVEVGLGIDVVAKDSETLQLRGVPDVAPQHMKKVKNYVKVALCLSVACSALLGVMGYGQIRRVQHNLVKRLEVATGKKVEASAQADEWISLIDRERRNLKRRGPSVHFHKAPVPVTELLNWISTHPDLQEGFEVDRLSYSLESYPNLAHPLHPFKVKVDLTFRANSPLLARDFHQSLMSEEKIVDVKETIHWERGEKGYHCSFYLKNS
ncbi:MAG: hypothetical protein MRY21_00885 [Simkaniaceae bacterium]|nr:hypothetical protein [Simkaniaceae bacterium]